MSWLLGVKYLKGKFRACLRIVSHYTRHVNIYLLTDLNVIQFTGYIKSELVKSLVACSFTHVQCCRT